MKLGQKSKIAALTAVVVNLLGSALTSAAQAQVPAPPPLAATGAIARRVTMKDSLAAEQLRAKLEAMKAQGMFRSLIPGIDPKNPNATIEISFLTSGNYVMVVGRRDWVDSNIETIRLMAFLFERPRALVQLNLRVVQLTGPANPEVIQMSETVKAIVDAQRDEVVRTFAELDEYLTNRMRGRSGADRTLLAQVQQIFPSLGTGQRPATVPEILVLLMLDRSSPAPRSSGVSAESDRAQNALLELPRVLTLLIQDRTTDETRANSEIQDELAAWKKAVGAARDWCSQYSVQLKESKDRTGIGAFRQALQQSHSPLPSWLSRRLLRSLELTERLYPNLVREHTMESLKELHRRFTYALERSTKIEQALAKREAMPAEPKSTANGNGNGAESEAPMPAPSSTIGRNLLQLKSVADQLVPAPLALFESVAATADNSAPTPQQLVEMFKEYTQERAKLDARLGQEEQYLGPIPSYDKLQTLEASLNLWLRRVSEGMARSLEAQFYRRYTNELRLLANKELGKTSNRDLLSETHIDQVPDVARDLLLSDNGVNIYVSNSISMQFAPDATNTVSATVQAQLPSKLGIMERLQQAESATRSFNTLSTAFGISGESVVKALLAGGQAVPVQGGINLTATPSVGFDASTITLTLTANQTLQPGTDKVADRVTNHSINNATITALSYEPMVLSTLASNISYYEDTGGIPILRKAPILKDLLKDIPLAPFKQGKRQKGVYQSSVIILEPVVIPTIEDLVRFHSGWRTPGSSLIGVQVLDDSEPLKKAPAAAAATPTPAAPK